MILVTGINGFVGKHLARELNSQGFEIMGLSNFEDVPHPEIKDLISEYYKCDITSPEELKKLDFSSVSGVINLAGLASTGDSYKNPELYMKVNVEVLTILGNEILRQSPLARVLAISSGTIYDSSQPMPLSEDSELLKDGSPYALSKIAMEVEAQKLRKNGLDCIVARPFNHIGPGQGLGFLIPDLIQKIKSLDKSKPVLKVGNIDTVRDYTDVRDIVRAYTSLIAAEKLEHGIYNICNGEGLSGKQILMAICTNLGIDFNSINLEIDSSLIRPNDPIEIVGDNSRLCSELGWNSGISINTTIKDIIKSSFA